MSRLTVIEDAAQGVMATYKGKALDIIGDIGTYRLHEMKNYRYGEERYTIQESERFVYITV